MSDETEVKETEEKSEEVVEEKSEEVEEEPKSEINSSFNEEHEMLKNLEKKFNALEDKMDNMISMFVDSGSIVHDTIDDRSEKERKDYEEDFINIDDMDLSL